jgi:lipid-A-disaccharide synthase
VTAATRTDVTRVPPAVLVVAGEPSGDRIAARIAHYLQKDGVRCYGMGGPACRAANVELVADLRRSAAMGLTEVVTRLPAIARAFALLVAAVRHERPRAAVLVDYTEFNLRLGALLKRLGVPVLWCVAPQVWAWRPGRMAHVARALDRLAVILPFEVSLWRAQGVDAHYVGHPALDVAALDRRTARARLGLAAARASIAIMPGSRPHEVRRHARPMLATLKELAGAGMAVEALVVIAPSLDGTTRRWLAARAAEAGVRTIDTDAEGGAVAWLGAFDASLTASGTATLECALAGAPPVVVYRLSALTSAIARRVVRTPFIALPNIVLGSSVYPELLDRDVEPRRMARALGAVLERRPTFESRAEELRTRLSWAAPATPHFAPAPPIGHTMADRAASLLSTWLSSGARVGAVSRASEVSIPP